MGGDQAADRLDVGRDRLFDDRPEELLLGLEIQVERALGDAGPRGDLVEARRGEPLLANTAIAAPRISAGRSALRRRNFGSPGASIRASVITDQSVINP
jgi:hypothetical protein